MIDIVTNRLGIKIPRGMVANQNVLVRDASFYLRGIQHKEWWYGIASSR